MVHHIQARFKPFVLFSSLLATPSHVYKRSWSLFQFHHAVVKNASGMRTAYSTSLMLSPYILLSSLSRAACIVTVYADISVALLIKTSYIHKKCILLFQKPLFTHICIFQLHPYRKHNVSQNSFLFRMKPVMSPAIVTFL